MTVACSKGGFAALITSSTALLPSHRTVVRSPRSGSPPCIQRRIAVPRRTFAMLPAAKAPTTAIAITMNSAVMEPSPPAQQERR